MAESSFFDSVFDETLLTKHLLHLVNGETGLGNLNDRECIEGLSRVVIG